MLIIITETFCNLWPDGDKIFFRRFRMGTVRIIILHTHIVMCIENDIKAFLHTPVNDFLDTIHPCFADVKISVHMIMPAGRNADGAETGCTNSCNHLPCCFHAAPVSLQRQFVSDQGIIVCVKSVAEIPAGPQIAHKRQGSRFRRWKRLEIGQFGKLDFLGDDRDGADQQG